MAGIEPAIANYATYGFEDRGSHQTPSASAATMTDICYFVKADFKHPIKPRALTQTRTIGYNSDRIGDTPSKEKQ